MSGKPWSLEPTRALLRELGNPEREFATVHVGGTNGKGSVATLVHAALSAAGVRSALYTSPHLVDVRERMVVDRRPISREGFAAWVERLKPTILRTEASFFEATTAVAFADFAARGADVAVVEVGLGGRLDSTNVIQPIASVVTSIAREHTEYLGDSLEAIAREKAGIAKAGVPFVIGERDVGIAHQLATLAGVAEADPVMVLPPQSRYAGPLALAGEHQRRNAAIAWAVLDVLPPPFRPDPTTIAGAFAVTRVAGRFDRRGRWIFDVAHNAAGMRVLRAALEQAAPPRPLHALVGILKDKAWGEMLACLQPAIDRIWLTIPATAPAERRWNLDEVGAAAPTATAEPDFDRALAGVQRGAATVLVTGSFHTVGDALARLPGFAPLG